MTGSSWSAGSKGLGAEALKLASEFNVVGGRLALSTESLQAWRKQLGGKSKAAKEKVAADLAVLLVRLQKVKSPATDLAVVQMIAIIGDLLVGPLPEKKKATSWK